MSTTAVGLLSTILAGLEADPLEALAKAVVAEGVAGASAWEQPGFDIESGDDVAAPAGGDQLADQGSQRLGKGDRDPAKVMATVSPLSGQGLTAVPSVRGPPTGGRPCGGCPVILGGQGR